MRENESDDRLMGGAAKGDTDAFDVIVRRYQHRLQRFATRMLGGDFAMGPDIAVGKFLGLWAKRKTYVKCGQLDSWLVRTTYRLCLDVLRQNQNTLSQTQLRKVQESDPGSCSLNQALDRLVHDGKLSPETANENRIK